MSGAPPSAGLDALSLDHTPAASPIVTAAWTPPYRGKYSQNMAWITGDRALEWDTGKPCIGGI
jgi:hypothetical protein